MARLSLTPPQHYTPPYEGLYDSVADAPRKARRSLLKRLGVPASDDVRALAQQMKMTIESLEYRIGIRPNDVIISVPHLVALYQDDISDACEFLGLRVFDLPQWFSPLVWETSAVAAGYGQGLRKDYRDSNKCEEEKGDMERWNLLTVCFSRTALTTSLTPFRSVYGTFEPQYRHRGNFSVAYDALATPPPRECRKLLGRCTRGAPRNVQSSYSSKGSDMVIVRGEPADDSIFREVLKNAVMSKNPLVFNNDTAFAVAKGTAEFRLRPSYVPAHSSTIPEIFGAQMDL